MEFTFPPQRRQSPRGKSKQRKVPATIDKAQWTWHLKEVLLRCCHEEVTTGEGLNGTLTRRGWNRVKASFFNKTQLNHDISQLKNEHRRLKKDYSFIMGLLHHQTGAGLHPITGSLEQEQSWWVAKDVEHKGKAMAYRFVDLRPYRDLGPAVFEGNMATGEYSIAPSKYSNTFHAAGEDLDDSDPDKAEGSGDSGDDGPTEIRPYMELSDMTGSGGSFGKRKRVVMATSSLVTECRRRLAVTEMTGGSMQTTGEGKATQLEASSDIIPSIAQCMRKLSDLEESNIDLHTHAVFLIENPVNRQILCGFTSIAGRDAWLNATKNAKTAETHRS